MTQQIRDFVSLGSFADFIQLIKVDHRIHHTRHLQGLYDPSVSTTHVGIIVSHKTVTFFRTTKGDELKGASDGLTYTLFDQSGFSIAGRTLDADTETVVPVLVGIFFRQ